MSNTLIGVMLVVLAVNLIRFYQLFHGTDEEERLHPITVILSFIIFFLVDTGLGMIIVTGLKLIARDW